MAEGTSGTTVSVHRCRFVDYTPSAITALAFPPLPLPSIKGKENAATPQRPPFGNLVVGRANGSIELCEWTGSPEQHQSAQAWVVKKVCSFTVASSPPDQSEPAFQTLSGPYPSKVDSLALTIRYPDDLSEDQVPTLQALRLFSAGGGSDLAEWDIQSGCIRVSHSSSYTHICLTETILICIENRRIPRRIHLVCLAESIIYVTRIRLRGWLHQDTFIGE